MVATTFDWLPQKHPTYGLITSQLLPFALGLLLLNVHLPTVLRVGWRALVAMGAGAASIVAGMPLIAWLLRSQFPPEAWKGVGTLAGTWTGGSMNLLALRTILETPEAIFTSLIVVDAIMAYGWMMVLVILSSYQAPINRWLRAETIEETSTPVSPTRGTLGGCANCCLVAGGLVVFAGLAAARLPTTSVIASSSGWTMLLVTTGALVVSSWTWVTRQAHSATHVGTPLLYLVLASLGAQASLEGLRGAPVWIALGVGVALLHGLSLLVIGRWMRLPLGLLATASQANFGGVVSAPLVGAIYSERLAPIGLCLAIAGNALGTYLGLVSASFSQILLKNP